MKKQEGRQEDGQPQGEHSKRQEKNRDTGREEVGDKQVDPSPAQQGGNGIAIGDVGGSSLTVAGRAGGRLDSLCDRPRLLQNLLDPNCL